MSLFSLIIALLLEQLKPLYKRGPLQGWLTAYVEFFQQHFNSGEYSHGKAAWWLAVLPVATGAVLLFWGLHYLHPLLAVIFNVAALYLSMGFGQYSRCFTDIQQALHNLKLDEARVLLSTLWQGRPEELNREEVARLTIEISLLSMLHHLFGVIVWFSLFGLLGLGGGAGALLYCLVLLSGRNWRAELTADESGEARFDEFARAMSEKFDWLPIRLTAATFAIVGNFEDTVFCWRSQASSWHDGEEGILLASAAGASGVRLGLTYTQQGQLQQRPELGVSDKGAEAAMQCTRRLVRRSVLFALVLLFMLTLAGLMH